MLLPFILILPLSMRVQMLSRLSPCFSETGIVTLIQVSCGMHGVTFRLVAPARSYHPCLGLTLRQDSAQSRVVQLAPGYL